MSFFAYLFHLIHSISILTPAPCVPSFPNNMHPATAAALISEYQANSSWTSTFWFPTHHGNIDLLPGTGPSPICLPCLPCQPDVYPPGTSYRFDPDKYRGEGSMPKLIEDVTSCLGDSFFYCRGEYESIKSTYTTYYLRCSFNNVAERYSDGEFVPDSFSKKDTITEPIKRSRKKPPTKRMPTSKLRTPKRKRDDVALSHDDLETPTLPKNAAH